MYGFLLKIVLKTYICYHWRRYLVSNDIMSAVYQIKYIFLSKKLNTLSVRHVNKK